MGDLYEVIKSAGPAGVVGLLFAGMLFRHLKHERERNDALAAKDAESRASEMAAFRDALVEVRVAAKDESDRYDQRIDRWADATAKATGDLLAAHDKTRSSIDAVATKVGDVAHGINGVGELVKAHAQQDVVDHRDLRADFRELSSRTGSSSGWEGGGSS